MNLDLHLAVCFRFELLDPRLDDVELEKARRSQKMAKLERDRLRMGRAKCKREQNCKRKIRARIALSPHESNLYPKDLRMHVLRFAGKATRSQDQTPHPQRPGKRGFAHRRNGKPRPRRIRIQDLLPRTPSVSGKIVRRLSWRPTRSPTAASSAARSSAPPHAAPAGSCRSRSNLPDGPGTTAGAAHTTAGSPQDAPASAMQDAQPAHPPAVAPVSQPSEPRTGCGSQAQHPASSGNQTRRQQRMAPERKEVVVDPHTLQTKHLRKQRAQDLLLRRARCSPQRAHRLLRRRQRTTVELAVGRQRKTIQHHERRRHHVLGKSRRKRRVNTSAYHGRRGKIGAEKPDMLRARVCARARASLESCGSRAR